jgi:hypothetical protein
MSARGHLIDAQNALQIQVERCQFWGNGAVNEINLERSMASVINSTFYGGNGRYIYAWFGNLDIIGSTFNGDGNIGVYESPGKALFSKDQLDVNIMSSKFINLKTTKSGGALYLQATFFDWYQEFYIENNEFT